MSADTAEMLKLASSTLKSMTPLKNKEFDKDGNKIYEKTEEQKLELVNLDLSRYEFLQKIQALGVQSHAYLRNLCILSRHKCDDNKTLFKKWNSEEYWAEAAEKNALIR